MEGGDSDLVPLHLAAAEDSRFRQERGSAILLTGYLNDKEARSSA